MAPQLVMVCKDFSLTHFSCWDGLWFYVDERPRLGFSCVCLCVWNDPKGIDGLTYWCPKVYVDERPQLGLSSVCVCV